MTNIITFGGLAATVPVGWFDVTDELSEGSPLTLAKQEGVGALQFTVAKYQAGRLPTIGEADLENLLMNFADNRGLGAPLSLNHAKGLNPYVCGSFSVQGELLRVWYVSNRKDVALITYVTQQPASGKVDEELIDATTIIESIDFP